MSKTKHRHGSERRQRSAQANTRLLPSEMAQLTRDATADGMSVSAYLRRLVQINLRSLPTDCARCGTPDAGIDLCEPCENACAAEDYANPLLANAQEATD